MNCMFIEFIPERMGKEEILVKGIREVLYRSKNEPVEGITCMESFRSVPQRIAEMEILGFTQTCLNISTGLTTF